MVLGKSLTYGLDDTTLTADAKYSNNLTQSNRKFCLGLPYNGSNSFLFVNATKTYQFKAKDSKIKKFLLCLGDASVDFLPNNMIKTGLSGSVYNFSVDYNIIDTGSVTNIYKYLIESNGIE